MKQGFVMAVSTAVLALLAVGAPAQSAEMKPFTMDDRAGLAGSSPADVSFLLDAPAGKHGFLRAVDGHLETGDGQRMRLWGVNLTDWSPGSTMIPARKDAVMWAATLARYGVNCVRLQFLDFVTPRGLIAAGKTTRRFDARQMDREDYFLAQLEKHGILIDFNLLVGRPFQAGDGVTDAADIGQGAKGVSLYDPRLINLQREYARDLLTHYNPYTRREYRNDPGVAIVEINNEDAIWVGFRAPAPYYSKELDAMYNQWLRKEAPVAEALAVRRESGAGGEEPVPLLTGSEVTGAPAARYNAEAQFYLWLERGYFRKMRDYLRRGLGVKCVVLATADHNHGGTAYPLELALSSFSVLDGHDYWEGPWERKVKSPMVNDPLHSTAVELSRTAVEGKPYTVSEVNEPFANDYEAEQIPILAAYGDLQGWDAIFWYTFEPKKDLDGRLYVGDPFDMSLDPVKMTELATGALMFLRGDVSAARKAVTRSYTEEQVFASDRLPGGDGPYFTPGFPLWLPLEHESRISSLHGPATAAVSGGEQPNPIVSDTGELTWNLSREGEGAVTINSPRSQGLIGFRSAETQQPENMTAKLDNAFAAILLTSLDGRPIAESERILLTTGARVTNTGMQWNSAHTGLAKWGGPPTLIEPVTGEIDLHGLKGADAVLVQPLNGAGLPLGPPLRATRNGEAWEFAAGQTATTWYAITVRR